MSIPEARREIERFLSSADPEVLCLKGKWGVGKSFAWGTFIADAKATLPLSRYAYVSLFGLDSLDQLRLSIVANGQRREDIGKPLTLEKALSDSRSFLSRYRSIIPLLRSIPWAKDIAAVLEVASFFAVRGQLICLDDLERKGNNLKIKDVLGLVSYLKEQRSCKVVLISNDDAFEGDEKKDFNRFFEKTVDSNVTFDPGPEECADIALREPTALHRALRTHCISLRLSNIRVIRRIERLGRLLVPILDSYDPRIFRDAVEQLTLLGWCAYGEDKPSLDFVRARRVRVFAGKEEPSKEEKEWGPILDSYGFQFTEMSSLLLQGIERGYFDDVAIPQHAAQLHSTYKAQASVEDFSQAWRLYHDSFGDDQDELVKQLSESLRRNARYIAAGNANAAFKLLRDLGQKEMVTELISLYVEAKPLEAFDERALYSASDIDDPEFAAAVAEKAKGKTDLRSLEDILTAIARNQSREDIERLASFTVDEYYAAFKGIRSESLSVIVREALTFGANDQQKVIAQRAREALLRIARENALNKRRVAKFGIKLDDDGAPKGG
jgi:hypothetical protein